MFNKWHHKLDQDGGALTVLGLPDDLEEFWSAEDVTGSLGDLGQRVRDMAGGDDAGLVSMYSVYPSAGGSLEFLAIELVPLRQAIQRVNEIHGGDDVPAELSVLDRSDGPDDVEGPVGPTFAHLRDAVHRLFSRAGEDGRSLTVLGVHSHPGRRPPAGE